jgi:hypothetical protein
MADTGNGSSDRSAVYVTFTTLKNTIEGFAQGVPNVIDRSAFTGQSWGVQSQLLAAFKFLGLMTDEGKPTPDLHELAVPDEAVRKKVLDRIIRTRYAKLFALDLTKATLNQVETAIAESYGVSGETREKALRFFFAALDYLAIPVGRFLKPKASSSTSSTATPRRRRPSGSRKAPAESDDDDADDEQVPQRQAGPSKSVALKSGAGTVTVAVSMDPFALSAEDQAFVFDLINRLREYEKGAGQ